MLRWDIFCTVVDNLGDIGVCWRLARQLAGEHAAQVCLWVDDLHTFRRFEPRIDPASDAQALQGVEVRRWFQPLPPVEPADIVVETFGCELPASYIEAMAARPRPPVWINLEYLSAEAWVGGCHGLPSPHPPLNKYFFFPGFGPDTGGVLMERGLTDRRSAFQADAAGQALFLESFGVPARKPDELLVSLFCYQEAPLSALLEAWEKGGRQVRALAFEGTPAAQALHAAGLAGGKRRGRLAGRILPFLGQDDYDRVLWTCDWNFVRGEDSFVRAQWAGRPFVWQAYPQPGGAHRTKMVAFLGRYLAGADADSAGGLAALWMAWNGFAPADGMAAAWNACTRADNGITDLAGRWLGRLEALGDLAGNLARFCTDRV